MWLSNFYAYSTTYFIMHCFYKHEVAISHIYSQSYSFRELKIQLYYHAALNTGDSSHKEISVNIYRLSENQWRKNIHTNLVTWCQISSEPGASDDIIAYNTGEVENMVEFNPLIPLEDNFPEVVFSLQFPERNHNKHSSHWIWVKSYCPVIELVWIKKELCP